MFSMSRSCLGHVRVLIFLQMPYFVSIFVPVAKYVSISLLPRLICVCC